MAESARVSCKFSSLSMELGHSSTSDYFYGLDADIARVYTIQEYIHEKLSKM